jgi:hypothetical protein
MVSGGVRQSSTQRTPGPAYCITISAMPTGTTTAIRKTVSQCAALGINTLLKNDGALSPFFDCIREAEKSVLKILKRVSETKIIMKKII